MLYGAVDIGTNSCRLLIASVEEGQIRPLLKTLESTRIGQGVSAGGYLNPEAMERTVAALGRFQRLLDGYRVSKRRAVATSALREAVDAREFIRRVRDETGMEVEIISGAEEARLSYLGAEQGLQLSARPLLVDLGGGSTEFILAGEEGQEMLLSFPVGVVRAGEERFSAGEIRRRLQEIKDWQQRSSRAPLVFAGGTASSLVAIKLGLREYRGDLVHGQALTREEIQHAYRRLAGMSLEERRQLPGLQASRADIIPWGALIILVIMELLDREQILVTESDILEGIVHLLNRGGEQARAH